MEKVDVGDARYCLARLSRMSDTRRLPFWSFGSGEKAMIASNTRFRLASASNVKQKVMYGRFLECSLQWRRGRVKLI